MKRTETIRKMDNFEKRLSDLTKEYKAFKEIITPLKPLKTIKKNKL